MDGSGDALFPRRYLDEFERRVSELHRCAGLARAHAARARRQAVALYLDAADAHEQAAAACQLAGGNGHGRDLRARASWHRQVAAARRAAAALLSGQPAPPGRDDLGPRAAGSDGEPLTLPGPRRAGADYPGESCRDCRQRHPDTQSFQLPPLDDTQPRAIGPWQAV